MQNPSITQSDRREFMKAGALVTAATLLPGMASAQGSAGKEIKVALIGCGGRGTGAAS
ncbi:MAG: twin-arginine translocation signal domain-containing protein, partial [Akkermansiaceae bacterium]